MKNIFLFIILLVFSASLSADAEDSQCNASRLPSVRQAIAATADEAVEDKAYRDFLRADYLFKASSDEVSAEDKTQIPVLLFQSINAMPDAEAPLNLLMQWYAAQNNTDELRELLEELLASHPDSGLLKFYYAITLCDSGDYERVITLLEQFKPQSDFQRNAYYFTLYKAYSMTNKREKMNSLMAAVSADPAVSDSEMSKQLQLHHYIKIGDTKQASAYAQKLLSDDAFFNERDSIDMLMDDLTELDDVFLLQRYCVRLLNANDWEENSREWVRAFSSLFICNLVIGDNEGLLKQLDRLKQISNPELSKRLLSHYFERLHNTVMLQLKHARKPSAALIAVNAEFCKALLDVLDNPTPQLLKNAVEYFSDSGNFRDALAAAKRIPMPTQNDLFIIAQLHSTLKEYDEALKIYASLKDYKWEDDKASANYYFSYGMAAIEVGDDMLGIEKLKQALILMPNNAMLQNALGYTLADNGIELERAKQLVEMALKQEPDNTAIIDSMAWVYYRCGDYSRALETLANALPKIPNDMQFDRANAEYLDHLRQILDALGYQRLSHALE